MPDVTLTVRCSDPAATLWERLLSTRGLCRRGELLGKREGDSYSIETAAGDLFSGRITACAPPRELTLVVENMFESIVQVTIVEREGDEPGTDLEFTLIALGLHHDEIESFRSRWRAQLSTLFAGALTSG